MKQIIKILNNAGYERLGVSLSLGDITLNFDAILQGPQKGSELVLIETNQTNKSFSELLKRIEILTLLLSRTNSSRVVNLILDNFAVESNELRELEGFCRVIQVLGDSTNDIAQSLNTLLPLVLPEPVEMERSATSALERNLGSLAKDSTIKQLVNAAQVASEDVERIAITNLEGVLGKSRT